MFAALNKDNPINSRRNLCSGAIVECHPTITEFRQECTKNILALIVQDFSFVSLTRTVEMQCNFEIASCSITQASVKTISEYS